VLGLVRQSGGGEALADGTVRRGGGDGNWRPIRVSAVGDEVLGMRHLAGHEVRMTVIPGGPVEITALS
jgi:hypothetical protein